MVAIIVGAVVFTTTVVASRASPVVAAVGGGMEGPNSESLLGRPHHVRTQTVENTECVVRLLAISVTINNGKMGQTCWILVDEAAKSGDNSREATDVLVESAQTWHSRNERPIQSDTQELGELTVCHLATKGSYAKLTHKHLVVKWVDSPRRALIPRCAFPLSIVFDFGLPGPCVSS